MIDLCICLEQTNSNCCIIDSASFVMDFCDVKNSMAYIDFNMVSGLVSESVFIINHYISDMTDTS